MPTGIAVSKATDTADTTKAGTAGLIAHRIRGTATTTVVTRLDRFG